LQKKKKERKKERFVGRSKKHLFAQPEVCLETEKAKKYCGIIVPENMF